MTITKLGLIALPIAAMAIGCVQGKQDTPTAAESASATTAAPPASNAMQRSRPQVRHVDRRPPPMMRMHAGRVGEIFAAARQLPLNADQKAKLDKIEAPDTTGDPAMMKAVSAVNQELAAQVKAGKIDTAKLKPLYDGIDKASQDEQAKEADQLDQLHAVLDATQRKTLVDTLKKRDAERETRFKARIEQMKSSAAKLPSDKDRAAQRDKRELERMTRMLSLDPDQQKKIEPILAARPKPPMGPDTAHHEQMMKKTSAILDAFEKDAFDAKKLDLGIRDKKPGERIQQRAQFLAKLLPLLKPDQREKLATSVAHGPMMGGMMGGPMGRGPMMHRPGMGMGMGMGAGMQRRPFTLPFEDPPPAQE